MRRILIKVLTFYWMAAFVSMAYACIVDQGRGIDRAFHLLGAAAQLAPIGEVGGLMLAGVFGVAFTLGALLFLWSFVASLMEPGVRHEADDVMRLALAFGACVFAVLLVTAALLSISGIFTAVTLHVVAMLTSYLAVQAECASAAAKEADTDNPAQIMAANAARRYSLIKLAASNVHPLRGDR
jgi:hypothetical protein